MAAFSATGARPAFAAAVVLVFDEQPESKRALIRITGIVLKYFIIIYFDGFWLINSCCSKVYPMQVLSEADS